jgi:molybdopterin/thiamine biosynthesis adenylyltransferase
MPGRQPLGEAERALVEWQLDVSGFGKEGQERLKGARVLISRCGGVGGAVAHQLAAAGVGKLRLAHAGNVRASDLNRQLLMSYDGIGSPRLDLATGRLRELNPFVEIEAFAENVGEDNIERLVDGVDLVVSCAPLFAERLLMNRAARRRAVPLIDCAMYELEVQMITVLPDSPCLACLYPEAPPAWNRRFPVFGATAGTAGCLGAVEAIKVLAGLGEPVGGTMLLGDLREMRFQKMKISRRPDCPVCSEACL